jgi:hypothetical protein
MRSALLLAWKTLRVLVVVEVLLALTRAGRLITDAVPDCGQAVRPGGARRAQRVRLLSRRRREMR